MDARKFTPEAFTEAEIRMLLDVIVFSEDIECADEDRVALESARAKLKTAPMTKRLTGSAPMILQHAIDAMQCADELGGVEDTDEYIALMAHIAAEATDRAATAARNREENPE